MRIKNIISNSLLTTCAFFICFIFAIAVPVPAKFFVNTFNTEVGQTVEFELKIEGTESVPVYTIISNLEYDKNLLSFKGATVQPGWVAVTPDDVTDTANGIIKRTAGYPTGLKQLSSIYKYTFTALAPGDAKVNIMGSSAYDANNTDLGLQNKSITVKIGGKQDKEVVEDKSKNILPEIKEEKKEVAKKPQTMTLNFAGQVGFDVSKDYTFVLKQNLKIAQDTIGSTTISMMNSSGESVWSEVKDFSINDSSELLVTVPANSVVPGNYVLNIETKHDNQKLPVQLTKEIGGVASTERIVTQEVPRPFIPNYIYAICAAMFAWYLLTIAYFKSKKFKKFVKNF